jgi:hypothetical protein
MISLVDTRSYQTTPGIRHGRGGVCESEAMSIWIEEGWRRKDGNPCEITPVSVCLGL